MRIPLSPTFNQHSESYTRIYEGLNNPRRAWAYLLRKTIERASRPFIRREIACSRPERDELGRRVKAIGGSVIKFGKPTKFDFAPPAYQHPKSPRIAEAIGRVQFDAPLVFEIPDVTLRGPLAVATLPGLTFIPEKEADRPDLIPRGVGYYGYEKIAHFGRLPKYSFEVATPLIGPMANAYFHWNCDYLTRLQQLFEYVEEVGTYPTVLIPSDPPTWIVSSLRLLGYPPEHIHEWEGGIASVDTLVLPSSRRVHCPGLWHSEADHYDPRAISWLADNFRSSSPPEATQDVPKTVVISREDAPDRRLLNEDEVMDKLRDYNPESVILSNHSLSDQIALFRDADLVIGPHGAGLTNLIHSESTAILEIYGAKHNGLFYSLAVGQGLPYSCIRAQDVEGDLMVEPNVVETAVETLIRSGR